MENCANVTSISLHLIIIILIRQMEPDTTHLCINETLLTEGTEDTVIAYRNQLVAPEMFGKAGITAVYLHQCTADDWRAVASVLSYKAKVTSLSLTGCSLKTNSIRMISTMRNLQKLFLGNLHTNIQITTDSQMTASSRFPSSPNSRGLRLQTTQSTKAKDTNQLRHSSTNQRNCSSCTYQFQMSKSWDRETSAQSS